MDKGNNVILQQKTDELHSLLKSKYKDHSQNLENIYVIRREEKYHHQFKFSYNYSNQFFELIAVKSNGISIKDKNKKKNFVEESKDNWIKISEWFDNQEYISREIQLKEKFKDNSILDQDKSSSFTKNVLLSRNDTHDIIIQITTIKEIEKYSLLIPPEEIAREDILIIPRQEEEIWDFGDYFPLEKTTGSIMRELLTPFKKRLFSSLFNLRKDKDLWKTTQSYNLNPIENKITIEKRDTDDMRLNQIVDKRLQEIKDYLDKYYSYYKLMESEGINIIDPDYNQHKIKVQEIEEIININTLTFTKLYLNGENNIDISIVYNNNNKLQHHSDTIYFSLLIEKIKSLYLMDNKFTFLAVGFDDELNTINTFSSTGEEHMAREQIKSCLEIIEKQKLCPYPKNPYLYNIERSSSEANKK